MIAINVKPLGNRILIKRSKVSRSKGGIILPDTSQEKPKEGEVISIGQGRIDDKGVLHALPVKVGDRVMFSSYSGTEIQSNNIDEEFLILSEDDILGIFA